MKKRRLEQKFIEELERVHILSVACEKVGLSRQSVYRWMEYDPKFRDKVEKAIVMGIESVSDLAESKLISAMNKGEAWSIKLFLTNHNKRYKPKKPEFESKIKFIPVREIYHEDFDPSKHSTVRKDIDY